MGKSSSAITQNITSGSASGGTGSRRRRNIFLGALVVGALALAACGSAFGSSSRLEPAPDFHISLYQGEERLGATELKLSDFRGRPLVLNFWAGLCGPCRAEMPDFQEFYEEFHGTVTLLGLDVGPFFKALGSRDDGRDLFERLEVMYPTGTTFDQNVVREYEVLSMPSTFFITSDGKIFRKWSGLLNKAKLTEITNAMLAAS